MSYKTRENIAYQNQDNTSDIVIDINAYVMGIFLWNKNDSFDIVMLKTFISSLYPYTYRNICRKRDS